MSEEEFYYESSTNLNHPVFERFHYNIKLYKPKRQPTETTILQKKDDHFTIDDCKHYFHKEKYSTVFTNELLNTAGVERSSDESLSLQSIPCWPTGRTMNEDIGEVFLRFYLLDCDFVENWQYNIVFNEKRSKLYGIEYAYQIFCSIPTPSYPIVQVYTFIIVIIEVSFLKPLDCPVEIYYKYENMRTLRNLWDTPINEFWMQLVLDTKLKLFKTIKF